MTSRWLQAETLLLAAVDRELAERGAVPPALLGWGPLPSDEPQILIGLEHDTAPKRRPVLADVLALTMAMGCDRLLLLAEVEVARDLGQDAAGAPRPESAGTGFAGAGTGLTGVGVVPEGVAGHGGRVTGGPPDAGTRPAVVLHAVEAGGQDVHSHTVLWHLGRGPLGLRRTHREVLPEAIDGSMVTGLRSAVRVAALLNVAVADGHAAGQGAGQRHVRVPEPDAAAELRRRLRRRGHRLWVAGCLEDLVRSGTRGASRRDAADPSVEPRAARRQAQE